MDLIKDILIIAVWIIVFGLWGIAFIYTIDEVVVETLLWLAGMGLLFYFK